MAITIRIPTPLRSYTNGQSDIPVEGTTVGEALNHLMTLYPSLRPHLFNSEGHLRAFVNLFLNGENIRELRGIDTPIKEHDRLMLIPSIAGG